MFFCSKELMLLQQFCCSVVGEYEQVQAHLCITATTFYALPVPLPRQVSDMSSTSGYMECKICQEFGPRILACHVPNVACHGVSISIASISSVS